MKAIILAGGKGTRLQSVVSELPKPMAMVGGKPFLEILLKQLQKNSIRDVILSVGYKRDVIIDFFGTEYEGVNIEYCIETVPLGTGGAVKKAIEESCEERYFVINGDTFFDIDFDLLKETHEKRRDDITIATKRMYNSDRYGSVEVDSRGRIHSFKEKCFYEESVINAGIYIVNRDVIVKDSQGGSFSLEKDVFEKRVQEIKIGSCLFEDYFIDIGVPEDYYKAQEELVTIID